MDVQAKITPEAQPVVSGTTIQVQDSVTVAPGDNIALQIQPDMVTGYVRQGADMIVQLKNGETLRIANFYADSQNPAHLFLVDAQDQLVAVNFDAAGEGALAASYAPQGVAAEFAATGDAVAAAGVGGSEAAAAGAGAAAGGGGLGAAAILGGVAVLGGGIAAAAGGGGGDDDGGDGSVDGGQPPAPPVDTTPPAVAAGLALSADGATLTGTAEAGATVRVDTNGDGNPDATATVGADGRFSITLNPPLTNGETVSVTIRDGAGNTSAAATVTASDTTPPAAVTGLAISADGTTLTGQATPGVTVRVDTNGDGTPDQTATAGSDGRFSFTLAPPLTDGETVSVTAVDAAGNASAAVTATATDTTAPAAVTGLAISADGTTLTGQATPGVTVRVDSNGDGTPDQTAVVGADGSFSFTLAPPLTDGETVSVTAVDAAGNASAAATAIANDTTPPAAVTGLAISADGATLTGQATPGVTVRVDINGDGTPDQAGTAGADGSFSFTLAPALIDGETVSVTAVDAVGNASAAVTATAPDMVPTPDAPVIDDTNGSVVTGTAEPNTEVILFAENGVVLARVQVDAEGDWRVELPTPVPDEAWVRAICVNSEGEASPAAVVQVDAVQPAPPVIDIGNAAAIAGTAEAGTTVVVTDGAGATIGTIVTGPDGAWSIATPAGLADGSSITAVAIDDAGNSSAPATAALDLVAPAAPTITPSNGALLTGTAEPASYVELTTADGTVIGNVFVDDAGNWAFVPVPALGDGVQVTATVEDAAGNIGGAASVVIDSVPPAVPVIQPSNGDVLRGTTDAGALVTLATAADGVLAQVTADANGNWSFDPAGALTDGTVVQAIASDAAGNVSGSGAVRIDATPPAVPEVVATNGRVVIGTGEAGSTVTVTGPGGVLGTAVVDGDGGWVLQPATPIPDGTTLSITAADASGNTSAASSVVVDALPPLQPVLEPTNGNVIVGTTEAGAQVTFTADGEPLGTVRADAAGNFILNPDDPLPDGTVIGAIATDAAGNASTPGLVTTDDTLPSIPDVDPTNGVTVRGLADPNTTVIVIQADGVEIGRTVTNGDGLWNFTFPTPLGDGVVIRAIAETATGVQSAPASVITDALPPAPPVIDPSNGLLVTGSAEAGADVLVYDDAGGLVGFVVADANGRWSFDTAPTLADGTVLTATARDRAGNVSGPATSVVDAAPPEAPTIAATNGAALSGTAEANATVVLTDAGGAVIGTVVADASGNWSTALSPSQPDGAVVTAIARDATGNVSPSASVSVDAVAPGVPTVNPSDGATVTGTAEAGATITIAVGNGLPVGTTTVDANGNWSFTPTTPFTNNTLVEVRALDAAGNASGQAATVVDSFAPPIPAIAPTDGEQVSGTTEPGATVVLSGVSGVLYGEVVADPTGVWSWTPPTPLPDGTVLFAYSVDAAGNTSSLGTVTVDDVAPVTPVLSPSNGALITGTAEPGVTVTLTLADGTVLGTPLTGDDGRWSLVVTPAINDGVVVTAFATDPTGNTSGSASVTVDATPPATPTVDVSDGTTLSGTSDSDVVIILQEGGGVIGTATPDADGNWTFTPTTPLVDGSVVTVVATDPAGNPSTPVSVTVDSIAPEAPVVAPSNGTVLTGTAEAATTITLSDGNGNPIGTTITNATGAWSFTPNPALADATVVRVTATDEAGNVSAPSSVSVDALAPGVPTIELSNGTALAGTAEAGVTLVLSDAAGNQLGTTVADVNGNWAFVPAPALANATTVSVIARDAVGNVSGPATTTIDSVAPGAPVIAASDGSPITGTAEANATITLTDSLGNAIGTTVAGADGAWTLTPAAPVANGTIVVATATDAAGNVSDRGAITIDAVAPGVPLVAPTNGATLTGTAEAGATITLADGAGAAIGTTTADANGNWAFAPAVQLGNGTVVNVTASDAAGNVGAPASVTVDSVAPDAPVLVASNGVNLAGTAEAGSTVTLSAGGATIGTVVADADGSFSFAPVPPLGNVVVTATATDASGNVSAPGTLNVDTSLPSIPVINPSNGIIVTGTADAGNTLTLTAGGAVVGTVVVGAGGVWSFTPATPLADGTVLVAVARNPAGTDSAPANGLVDAVAPAVPVVDLTNGTVIDGTAEAGALVTVSVGGAPIATVTADANGNWAVTPATPLADGTLVSVSVTDAAGNASGAATVTVDALPPAAPVIAPSSGAVLAGTAETGALVTLSAGGATLGQVIADANGNWAFTPVPALGNAVVVSATAADASGNVSPPASIAIDAVAPNAATGLQIAADGSLLTGTAEAGATVRVIVNGDAANPISVTAGAGGTFSVPLTPALLAGQDVAVVVVDAAGNTSLPALTEAPDRAPLVLTVAETADGYLNKVDAADGIQVSVGLTAGTDAGDTVTVRFAGQNGYVADYSQVVTAAERASGSFDLTLVPPQGMATFPQGAASVTAVSSEGPTSAPVGFTVDTIAPRTPVLSLVGNLLTISGEPNNELTVQVNLGGVVATATVLTDNSGLASLDLLADLDIQPSWDQLLNTSVSVRGEDPAGNVSNVATIGINPAEQLVTVGNLGLDVGLARLGFSGQTEPGASVRVEVVTPLVTAIVAPQVDANGNFGVNLLSASVLSQLGLSLTGLLNLGAGIALNVIATDAQGNDSARYGVTLAGSGLSLNIGQITVAGDNDVDILSGTNGASEVISAAGGSDLILNVGAGDRVDAGTGDDTIQLTSANAAVNGGDGFDTILLSNGIDIDYNGVGVGTWSNVERIDLGSNDSGSVLTLNAAEIDAITDGDNLLQITGDANDRLVITGAVDTGTTTTVEGLVYDVYSFGNTTVLVEDNSVTVAI